MLRTHAARAIDRLAAAGFIADHLVTNPDRFEEMVRVVAGEIELHADPELAATLEAVAAFKKETE